MTPLSHCISALTGVLLFASASGCATSRNTAWHDTRESPLPPRILDKLVSGLRSQSRSGHNEVPVFAYERGDGASVRIIVPADAFNAASGHTDHATTAGAIIRRVRADARWMEGQVLGHHRLLPPSLRLDIQIHCRDRETYRSLEEAILDVPQGFSIMSVRMTLRWSGQVDEEYYAVKQTSTTVAEWYPRTENPE